MVNNTKSLESYGQTRLIYEIRKGSSFFGKGNGMLQCAKQDLQNPMVDPSSREDVPNQWGYILSDLFYSFYGTFYRVFEFKILKDKARKLLKGDLVNKHD